MSYRRVQKKKKATSYCIRFGHSLWSAISCQRKRLKIELFLAQLSFFKFERLELDLPNDRRQDTRNHWKSEKVQKQRRIASDKPKEQSLFKKGKREVNEGRLRGRLD